MIGGGGHSSVLVDILRSQKREILAVISPEDLSSRTVFKELMHYRNNEDVLKFSFDRVMLINGIGLLPKSDLKRKINEYYLSKGYRFETVIAESAQVSPYAKIGAGVQIFPRAIVNTGSIIEDHTIVNSGVIIEHDCNIGEYNHIAPAATLCGQVKTLESVYIGAGATVIQNVSLGQNVIVGAGAVVTKNLDPDDICYPWRSKNKSN